MANYIDKSMAITWDGESHKIDITNELCNALESNGINLFAMSVELSRGGVPKFFLMGDLITKLLVLGAQIDVSQDDVMQVLTQEPADSVALFKFCNAFMGKVFPASDDSVKKPVKAKAKK